MSEKLSPEQKNLIAAKVNEGATLSDIQKFIKNELGVSMTYMDVRFLVDDLDLTLQDKTPVAPVAETPSESASPGESPAETPAPQPGAGKVSISVDPVQKPGVALGGSVTFSDGKTGQWQLDGYGQLGFVPPEPGYKPSPEDVRDFQAALQGELQRAGYA